MGDLLKDKVAVITGAARGNGAGIARVLAGEGAVVCLWDAVPEVHNTAAQIRSCGGAGFGFQVDVTDGNRVREAAQEVVGQFGGIDILVNNAGIYPSVPFLEMTDELRDKVFAININGVLNCCKAVLPTMIEKRAGRIINVSSVTGPLTVIPGLVAYAASKGAVSAITKALAVEYAPLGITVNAVLPGTIDTPGLRALVATGGGEPEEEIARIGKNIPLGRVGTAADIGGAVLMLASDYASYITGAELVVDGGNVLPEWG